MLLMGLTFQIGLKRHDGFTHMQKFSAEYELAVNGLCIEYKKILTQIIPNPSLSLTQT